MNVLDLRQIVLNKIAKEGKISPNSQEIKFYKEALPPLSPFLKEVSIGLMLGDVSLQYNNKNTGSRIKFEWGDINRLYAFHVYDLFKMYCLSKPRKQVRVNRLGHDVTTWCFQTVTHSAFNVLADLFIVKGKKVIIGPALSKAFTPVSLAFWFMDDGGLVSYSPNRYAIQLHTQGFSHGEVIYLVEMLKDKYGLDCWCKPNKGLWTIAISGHSYSIFLDLVKPYIHESMKHKLPKGPRTKI